MGSAVNNSMPWSGIDPETNERGRILEWERLLANLHQVNPIRAKRKLAPPPESVEEVQIRKRLAEAMGIDQLVEQLGSSTTRPIAPDPQPIDRLEILTRTRRENLSDIAWWNLWDRWQAEPAVLTASQSVIDQERSNRADKREQLQRHLDEDWDRLNNLWAELDVEVASQVEKEERARLDEREIEQRRLDQEWEALLANETQVVSKSIGSRKLGEGIPFELVGVEHDSVAAVAEIGPVDDVIPERRSSVTPGGRPSTKKRTKTERNELYLASLAGALINVAKQVFAAAPGTERVVVALTSGQQSIEVLMVGTIERHQFASRDPQGLPDPLSELSQACSSSYELRGRTNEVVPLGDDDIRRTSVLLADFVG